MQLFFERIENVLHYSMITQNPYCSSVLNSCLKEDGDRLERLQVRVLRNLFNDFYIGYDSLCSKTGYSLSSRWKQDMHFKALKTVCLSTLNLASFLASTCKSQ